MIVTGGANVFPGRSGVSSHRASRHRRCRRDRHRRSASGADACTRSCSRPTLTTPPTEQAVIRYAKDRLAAYKVPKTVEFVDEIPRTAATKVNRSAMVEARGG